MNYYFPQEAFDEYNDWVKRNEAKGYVQEWSDEQEQWVYVDPVTKEVKE